MSTTEVAKSDAKTPVTPAAAQGARRRKKAEGRKKRSLKLKTDKEFAKKYFESKSKRAIDKKASFRKKKSKKK